MSDPMSSPPAKRRLGRGLDGLLPSAPPATSAARSEPAPARSNYVLPIEELRPGSTQPRKTFDDEKLDELAQSIRELGILEPILVRKAGGSGYEIVAGERRWRAAQRAGLKEVPVFVRELGEQAALEAALVENLQREDLNPIETARAVQRLIDEHGHTQETVATRLGKDRSTIANGLRLLKLPNDVLSMIEEGRLSEGHGRALLTASSVGAQQKLARTAVAKGWSVRETERRAREEGKPGSENKAKAGKNANIRDLEQRLSRALGSTVAVEDKSGRGQIVIAYSSLDELDRLLEHLLR